MTEAEVMAKEEKLLGLLASYKRLALAYSGGVDSTYLADVGHEVLCDDLHLLLDDTPSIPRSELAAAQTLAQSRRWNLTTIQSEEFKDEEFLKNDGDRCYVCKTVLFKLIWEYARQHDVSYVAHGENLDDSGDLTRVGHRAAVEQSIVAPLREVGMTKTEIRELSRRRNLPTWNKASMACLSSRVPIGTRLRLEDLAKVEKVEEAMKALGFRQYRARHHGDICRVEVAPEDIARAASAETRAALLLATREAGYRHVTLDLEGYRIKGGAPV
ncbi:MAG: ATP-dependent sacrificial sulfur transferase LarE [Nitrospiraceae bacterium]|nr:ATP-dependent sacrificial sulfur transferase LarE [Nitrospiraceae bacterium]